MTVEAIFIHEVNLSLEVFEGQMKDRASIVSALMNVLEISDSYNESMMILEGKGVIWKDIQDLSCLDKLESANDLSIHQLSINKKIVWRSKETINRNFLTQ